MELNDLLTRYDRRPNIRSGRNFEIDHSFSGESATEPVTSSEQKAYSRITSTAQDSIIAIMIKAARQAIERYTNMSLIERTVTVQFNNPCGKYELPWGPITGDVVFTDKDGNTVDDVELVGLDFKTVVNPLVYGTKAVFPAGYTAANIPSDLKIAIMDQVDFMYEFRGSNIEMGTICPKALATCQRWARNPIIG